MKSTKVQEFILELLDQQLEEVKFAVQEKAQGYSLEDVVKVEYAKQFFIEQNELDDVSSKVCGSWLFRDVSGVHADNVEHASVSDKMFADLEVVGGVYMMTEYYRRQLQDIEEYFDGLAVELTEAGYSRGSKEVSFFCKTIVRRGMVRNKYHDVMRFVKELKEGLKDQEVSEDRVNIIVSIVHEFEGVV